jgi:hypothetical protein
MRMRACTGHLAKVVLPSNCEWRSISIQNTATRKIGMAFARPSAALNLVFRVNRRIGERLAYRGEESGFDFKAGRAYAFDADGGQLRLASEAGASTLRRYKPVPRSIARLSGLLLLWLPCLVRKPRTIQE